MNRISDMLSDEDRKSINRAVGHAESKCAAEIVPVVARVSGRYDRAEDMFGFAFAIIVFGLAWLLFQREDPSGGGWEGLTITLQLPVLVAILIVSFIVGTFAATRIAPLRRPFISSRHMKAAVSARAREAFFNNRIRHTSGRSGLLIFVSMEEKLALLLADRTVNESLGREGLDALRDQLLRDLKTTGLVEALCGVIAEAGNRLEPKLPREADDVDELPDALVIVEA